MNKIESIVKKYMLRHHMWKHDGSYIVALSGGADSVALLLILTSIGMPIRAAHCNFHLRGEESDRDEQFCVELCQRLGITLSRIHFDTEAYAQQHKVSIEMAARDLRYRYFHQLMKDLQADGICVAHHRDDNVETLLLNLLRGSGVDGLAAIAPVNGNILRPLLCISRADILNYLKEKGQAYVTDSTNLEDDALRNKIRHHVIPLLESINPAAKENIAQSAKYIRQAKETLDSLIESNTIGIALSPILQAASPEFMLHHHLGKYGFHGEVIEGILESLYDSEEKGVGKVWKSATHMMAIDREQLIVAPLSDLDAMQHELPSRLPEEGNYTLSDTTRIKIYRYPRTADFVPSKNPMRITLDADKVRFPLTYRLTETGDRFRPFGMKGTKLVSDYMTDRKRNALQKMSQHVLTDKEGNIVWLVGERTSEDNKITPTSQNILEIHLLQEKGNREG